MMPANAGAGPMRVNNVVPHHQPHPTTWHERGWCGVAESSRPTRPSAQGLGGGGSKLLPRMGPVIVGGSGAHGLASTPGPATTAGGQPEALAALPPCHVHIAKSVPPLTSLSNLHPKWIQT